MKRKKVNSAVRQVVFLSLPLSLHIFVYCTVCIIISMSTVHIIDVDEQQKERQHEVSGWLTQNEMDKNAKLRMVFDRLSKHQEFEFHCIAHKHDKNKGRAREKESRSECENDRANEGKDDA